MLSRLHEDQARSRVRVRVGQGKLRRRAAIKHRSVNDSGRRRLRAQVTMDNLAEVRRLEFINQSTRLVGAGPRLNRAARENEGRVRMASRPRRNIVARLLRLSIIKASRKVENKRHRKKPRRPGRNNFSVTNTSGSGM